ncbi:MAG: carbohydrate ABC transporter substrate-binding protein, partial [Terrimesophilobacter sp.]
CAGFGSDAKAGTLGADWIEDLVLREAGPYTYDQWVAHHVSFSDPAIKHAFESFQQLLLGSGDTAVSFSEIAPMTTGSTDDIATALGAGSCALAHGPVSFARNLTDPQAGNTTVGPKGALWAFLMPSVVAGGNSVTGGGDIVAAFSNDADTIAVQKYLSSAKWANSRVTLGGVISANNAVDPAEASTPILTEAMKILQDPRTVFRFDASDQMPESVGSGSFPACMEHWVGGASLATVLLSVDAQWPTE